MIKSVFASRSWPTVAIAGLVVAAVVGLSTLGGAAAPNNARSPADGHVRPQRFSHDTIIAEARRLAAQAYEDRAANLPQGLAELNYDQHRDIRFRTEAAIWRTDQVPFRLDLLPAGFLFRKPVSVAIVENGVAHAITPQVGMFHVGPLAPQHLAKVPLPFSGFRVRSHINSRSVWDEFLVFQGASYFRAVAKGQWYGLSARGLALRTAEPIGEEFPAFTRFWVERPAANAVGIVIHALLESESTTGAYRFSVVPGTETVMNVDATLFPRVDLRGVGIAPLTSMFLFDESHRVRVDDFRDEVHDSDGLQVITQSGEQLWRPLANPHQLQVSSFTSAAPRGFGLVQRSRSRANYQDLEAQYERRPSAWIEPTSEWGAGAVTLIEIPTDSEVNDNIVAFWRPTHPLTPGRPWRFSYRLRWTNDPIQSKTLAKAMVTRSGPSLDGKRRVFVVDFPRVGKSTEGLRLDVGTSAGKVVSPVLQVHPGIRGVRASFELDPSGANVAELRVRVLRGDHPMSETWLYRWTAS